jgi:hypothetical protein
VWNYFHKTARNCPKRFLKVGKKLPALSPNLPQPFYKLKKKSQTNPIPYLWADIPTFWIPFPIRGTFQIADFRGWTSVRGWDGGLKWVITLLYLRFYYTSSSPPWTRIKVYLFPLHFAIKKEWWVSDICDGISSKQIANCDCVCVCVCWMKAKAFPK